MRQHLVSRDIVRLVGKFFPLSAPAVEQKISADSELKNYSVLAVLSVVTLSSPGRIFGQGFCSLQFGAKIIGIAVEEKLFCNLKEPLEFRSRKCRIVLMRKRCIGFSRFLKHLTIMGG